VKKTLGEQDKSEKAAYKLLVRAGAMGGENGRGREG
jgi:hypothetical protein